MNVRPEVVKMEKMNLMCWGSGLAKNTRHIQVPLFCLYFSKASLRLYLNFNTEDFEAHRGKWQKSKL